MSEQVQKDFLRKRMIELREKNHKSQLRWQSFFTVISQLFPEWKRLEIQQAIKMY